MSDHIHKVLLEKKRQTEQKLNDAEHIEIQSKRGRKAKPITSVIQRGPRGGYYFMQGGKKVYLSTRH